MHDNVEIKENKFFEKRGNIYTIFNANDIPYDLTFVQDKISKSFQGVIRGFHGDNITWKLITCLHGKVKLVTYDVDSDKKCTYILDGDSQTNRSILVPPRTLNAHQCLSSNCIFYYKWSEFYTGPDDQWSVRYDDPSINPEWDTQYHEIVSDRDKNALSLEELKKNVNC
jgi:dTDP-4-dehydrorhamnose 3,5-epimerase